MSNNILLDWQTNDTVFLDMDGTLLDLHFDNHFWLEHLPLSYAKQKQISLDAAKQYLNEHYHSMEGTLNWYCLDHWSENLNMDIIALKHEVADRIAIRHNVENFLDYLHQQGQTVILLTNAHRDGMNLKFDHVNIADYFDQVISSHDFQIPKEQENFWETLSSHLDFDKQRSMFIDDNLHVLRNAQRYGIQHLFAIKQPDSQQAMKDTEEFFGLDCFSQLMHT